MERYGTEIHVTPYNGTITFLDSKRDNDERTPSRQPTSAGGSTGADPDDDDAFTDPSWR